jgi:hypothetical protein
MSWFQDEECRRDARNTLAKTVTTHLGSVDFMTIPRAAFDSALRNIDAAREASGHTALLREIEVRLEEAFRAGYAAAEPDTNTTDYMRALEDFRASFAKH